ncbi:class I SAM-dependent methyltransferase [Arenimonas sp.]|uniref:class I SAM-dependent methyltransferase n=1 Tax=Arenimonas sp. TaxID=1872635 RepID=UPI0025BABBB2|nr:class I SAM-dependent methyltransferase [Arenimonas sp.]
MAPHDRLIKSWTANAAAWTDAVRSGRIESRRLATAAAIEQALLALSPARVLDVGCGEGWLCRALAAHGIEAVGIDVSAPLVEAARAAGGGRFELLRYAELADAAPRLGRFDALACNFALLECDIVPMLSDLHRLLAPGGRLVIQTVHPWSACGDEPYRDGWRLEDFAGIGDQAFPEPMPWYFRTLATWLADLSHAGFVIDQLQEPAHPDTQRPLSLLLVAGAADR